MKNSTGLDRIDFARLIDVLEQSDAPIAVPPILGIRASVHVTLKSLRRNRTQADIADDFGVSQPTISRAIGAVTPAVARALADLVPVVEDMPADTVAIVDGSLLPCWSWADRPDLYSGKHRTTGVNVQIASDRHGQLLWVSDPLPGSVHDVAALDTHGLLDGQDPTQFIGDKGYIGRDMTTPVRKPPKQKLTTAEKQHNTDVNSLRAPIERAIANLKTWRILHTDYRRPLHTFATTITAVLGLYFFTT